MTRSLAILSLILALFGACSHGSDEPLVNESSTPLVVATNHPLAWAARRLAADAVTVELLVPPDGDPAHWVPGDDAVARMQEADLILLVGAGHEPWANTAPLPTSRLVDTTASAQERLLEVEAGPSHAHGMKGEHSHGATAFTVWLDPTLFAVQVQAMGEALTELVPEQRDAVREREHQLIAELTALDARLAEVSRLASSRPLLGSHPVYQYLTERYDLDMRSVHWEPDADPGEEGWNALQRLLAERPAVAMLWEGEPLPSVRSRLAELGLASEVFAPSGNRPPDGADLLDVMTANAAALGRALAP
jgi:zinc transport system substrate-binding protein